MRQWILLNKHFLICHHLQWHRKWKIHPEQPHPVLNDLCVEITSPDEVVFLRNGLSDSLIMVSPVVSDS